MVSKERAQPSTTPTSWPHLLSRYFVVCRFQMSPANTQHLIELSTSPSYKQRLTSLVSCTLQSPNPLLLNLQNAITIIIKFLLINNVNKISAVVSAGRSYKQDISKATKLHKLTHLNLKYVIKEMFLDKYKKINIFLFNNC